ncbi:LacI family DNA-binding transcriptional regulator [Lysinibacter sp. HNR]|uniref:LacI family DNA-binding transcriptional regulator n=1 Tax=Lysinibacter sp. HNR TaxID=3031408 RepID=UPI002434952F|nr:LacI family DNA-binding transcriptional regulator [Lysinibacter sp. HNR]WGD36777.1 LacI family DNA-binding transcriptional regulator [Lysinibacter sp. HNR]
MVTLKEVAAAAGVAVSTASRALHQQDRVNASTEARIRKIAQELGYSVNHVGRALATGRVGLIGVVVPKLTNPFFAAVVEGIQLELEQQGSNVVLVEGRADPERERAVMGSLAQHVDALIVVTPSSSEADLQGYLPDVRVVTVDRLVSDRSGVIIDTAIGIVGLVTYLKDRGATKIAYVGGPPGSHRDEHRRVTFEQAAHETSIAALTLGPVEPSVENGVEIATQILEAGVDGVVVFSSHVALGLYFTLGESAGVEVTAVDDLSLAHAGAPLLTALNLPLVQVGQMAASLLTSEEIRHERFTPTLMLRS